MSISIENVKTTDGRCYVGMTKEQALEEGRKTANIFAKLDTNRDDVLSFDEVMKQRTKKKNKMTCTAGVMGALTLWNTVNSPFSMAKAEQVYQQLVEQKSIYAKLYGSPKGYMRSSWVPNLIWLGLTTWKVINTIKVAKQNKEYETQFGEEHTPKEQNETSRQIEKIKTTDDLCYVGMTKEQASEEGRKSAKLFAKLDTDGDDILSFDEVMEQRTQRENKIKTGRNIWGGLTIVECIGGIKTEAQYAQQATSKAGRIGQLALCIILTGITIGKHLKMEKWKKQDIEYRKQNQEFLKQEEEKNNVKQTEKEIEQIQEIQKAKEETHEIETAA